MITWKDVCDKIDTFRALPTDWDGEGAERPRDEEIDYALELATSLQFFAPPTTVVPIANGGIQFEWHDPQKGYLEAEITKDGLIDWMHERSGQYRHWQTTLVVGEL